MNKLTGRGKITSLYVIESCDEFESTQPNIFGDYFDSCCPQKDLIFMEHVEQILQQPYQILNEVIKMNNIKA